MISCAFLTSEVISENNDEKNHHLRDGRFQNRYASSIEKSFSDLIKWWWEGENPEVVFFELSENDP